MGKLFFIANALFIVSACSNAGNESAGGPCTYLHDTIPARVISIDSVGKDQRNLLLAIEKKGVYNADTIDVYAAFHYYVSPVELRQKNIGINDSLIFISGKIITGSCNPGAETSLVLAHFKK
jgi:hypothetical protein